MADVARHIDIPVATGEGFTSLCQFRTLLYRVELVEDVERRFPYRPRPIRMRPHEDGSVVDM